MKTALSLLVLLPISACLILAVSASEGKKAVTKPDIKNLYSEKSLTRQGTYMQLVEQRNTDIKSLIAILEDKSANKDFNGSLHYAVELLGEYRAVEAIDALMTDLFFVPLNFELDEMLPQEAYYVCAVALVKIGSPCLEKIYLRIPKAEKKERDLLAWIVMEILGKDESMAVLEIQKEKAGKNEKGLFDEAIEHIKQWQPKFENPSKAETEKTEGRDEASVPSEPEGKPEE